MIFNLNFLCKRSFPAILLIFLAGVTIYSNTFQVPFVLDDERSITQNDVITSLDNFYANSTGYEFLPNRFIGNLTFALNYYFGDLNVTGFHIVNLLIHLVTALLVFALLRLTFETPYFQKENRDSPSQSSVLTPHYFIPLFGALLFVVHPVQTQAVTYIVQRMTSLATLFYLLSVVLYVKARLNIEELGVRSKESGGDSQNSEFRIQNSKEENRSSVLSPQSSRLFFFVGSVLAAMLAMKTKEIAFTLPLAILLYEICFFRGGWQKRLLYLLPLLATLLIIPLTIIDIGGSVDEILADSGEQLRVGSISRLDYLFTQFRVIVTYLRLLLLPINLNLDYDYPVFTTFFAPQVFLSFLLLTAIFILGIYLFYVSRLNPQSQSKSSFQTLPIPPSPCEQCEPQPQPQFKSQPVFRLIAFGIFWFFLTLSVESTLIPIRDVIMEHRLYLPAFGAVAAFATAYFLMVEKLTGPSSGKLLFLGASIIILALSFATYQRNHTWGDAIRLWQDVVSKSPNKGRPNNNLGKAFEDVGRRSEAFKYLTRAIEVDPTYYKSYYNLADLYLVSDQPAAALPLLQTAIRLNPDFIEAYVELGAALMRGGQFRQVIQFLEQNLDRVGENAEAHFYLGSAYAFLGNREAALRELQIVSRLDPSLAADLAGLLGLRSNRGSPHGRQ